MLLTLGCIAGAAERGNGEGLSKYELLKWACRECPNRPNHAQPSVDVVQYGATRGRRVADIVADIGPLLTAMMVQADTLAATDLTGVSN